MTGPKEAKSWGCAASNTFPTVVFGELIFGFPDHQIPRFIRSSRALRAPFPSPTHPKLA
jgi:hypothetical protein